MRAPEALVPLLLLLGCATAPAPPAVAALPAEVLTLAESEERASRVLEEAFAADVRLDLADTLWAPEALVIADGELRLGPPRFAGLEPGGQAAISASRLVVGSQLVWGVVEYRWVAPTEGLVREGRATVLLARAGPQGRWWIVHAHSSSLR